MVKSKVHFLSDSKEIRNKMLAPIFFMLLSYILSVALSSCPGATDSPFVANVTNTSLVICDICVNVTGSAIREEDPYVIGICALDVHAITSCLKAVTDRCTVTHFPLIAALLSPLFLMNGIDTSTWETYQDLQNVYNEKCPEAHFLSRDTRITINTDFSVGEVVYIITTSNDIAALFYGIIMKKKSAFFDLSPTNRLNLLVTSQLVTGTEELEFDINSPNSCGPANLTVFIIENSSSTYTVFNGSANPSGTTNEYSTTRPLTQHTHSDVFAMLTTSFPITPFTTDAAYSSGVPANNTIFKSYSVYNSTVTNNNPITPFRKDETDKSMVTTDSHFSSSKVHASVQSTVTAYVPITPFRVDASKISVVTTEIHVTSFRPSAADKSMVTTGVTIRPFGTDAADKSTISKDFTITPIRADAVSKSVIPTEVPITPLRTVAVNTSMDIADVSIMTIDKSLVTTDIPITSFTAKSGNSCMVTTKSDITSFRTGAAGKVTRTTAVPNATNKSIVATYEYIMPLKDNTANKSMMTTDISITSLFFESTIASNAPVMPFRTKAAYRTDVSSTPFRANASNETTDNQHIRHSIFRNSVTKVPVMYSTYTLASASNVRKYVVKGFFSSTTNVALIISLACLISFAIAVLVFWCLCMKRARKKAVQPSSSPLNVNNNMAACAKRHPEPDVYVRESTKIIDMGLH